MQERKIRKVKEKNVKVQESKKEQDNKEAKE